MKPLGTHGLQPQTIRVGVSCLHSSFDMTSWLLSCLEYDVPLLRPHRRCQDQIWFSLLAQSNWAVYDINVYIELQMMRLQTLLVAIVVWELSPWQILIPTTRISPSCKILAYLPEFGLLAQFGHSSADDGSNCESSESRWMHTVAPKSERQTMTLDQKWSSSKLYADITHERCRSSHTSQLCTWYEWV
jgi:uncharacterized membrane protein (GlpM family)